MLKDFDQIFMSAALKQAKIAYEKDEVPVGAVITSGDTIIAQAHNQVETLKDPTAHAEMIAITQAANTIGSKWLYDCNIYVTVEPCAMCAGALILARIGKIYFGTFDKKTGACGSFIDIANREGFNHKIDIVSGLLEYECSLIISKFFKNKRKGTLL